MKYRRRRISKTTRHYLKRGYDFVNDVFRKWNDDNCFLLAASLSYFTLFSFPAMLVIIITVAGSFYGESEVKGQLFIQMEEYIGKNGVETIESILQYTHLSGDSITARTIGIITLLLSATLSFSALQNSLNQIWHVKAKPKIGLIKYLFSKLLAFGLVIFIGLLLVAIVLVETVIKFLHDYIQVITDHVFYIAEFTNHIISFFAITLMFATLFKYLPDIKIEWKAIWKGALLTSFLFILGRYLISFYLANSNITSAYGAAGSLVMIILWVNYSAWIFFFGAEFISVYSKWKGYKVTPNRFAIQMEHKEIEVLSK